MKSDLVMAAFVAQRRSNKNESAPAERE